MKKKEWVFLISAFIFWELTLHIFLSLSQFVVPLQHNFLGGGIGSYLSNPHLWAWANFDGEHYLSVARDGYLPLTYFYFPAYPILGRIIAGLFGSNTQTYLVSLLFISNVSFFIGLVGFYKLAKDLFRNRIAKLAVVSLLLFPSSFYFAAAYTESLFFALAVWSFYFARQKKWILAGVLGGVLSSVRIVGGSMAPSFFMSLYGDWKKRKFKVKKLSGVLIMPTGVLAYMYYLYRVTGDPLEFLHSISIFGQQRSSGIVILPQVFYRYVFKIIPSLNYSYLPIVFVTWLELLSAVAFLLLIFYAIKKMSWDLIFYSVFAYIIPTLSGSFSSFHRYVLVIFPAFFMIAHLLNKSDKYVKIVYFFISLLSLFLGSSLFFRGVWFA